MEDDGGPPIPGPRWCFRTRTNEGPGSVLDQFLLCETDVGTCPVTSTERSHVPSSTAASSMQLCCLLQTGLDWLGLLPFGTSLWVLAGSRRGCSLPTSARTWQFVQQWSAPTVAHVHAMFCSLRVNGMHGGCFCDGHFLPTRQPPKNRHNVRTAYAPFFCSFLPGSSKSLPFTFLRPTLFIHSLRLCCVFFCSESQRSIWDGDDTMEQEHCSHISDLCSETKSHWCRCE
jgi:hypothetical protein